MIDCTAFDQALVDFVANELPAETAREMDGHARQCTHCRAHLETYRIMISISAHLPTHALPEGVANRLHKSMLEAIRQQQSPES